jgi:hypothetical protein
MKRIAAAALVLALNAPGAAFAQSVLTVAYGKTISVPAAGATSAYAVNPTIAQAGVVDGVVTIKGVGAGTTSVIVVTRGGTQTLDVTVTAPQLAISLGVAGSGGGGDAGGISEGGSLESAYDSGAGQFTNALEFHQRQGDSYRRLTIVSATYVTPGIGRGTGFPLISYEVGGPGHDVVYLDQAVTLSPLTFQDALIRGIHVRTGPWTFHAGASSVAAFGPYFIPTNPQWVAGLSRDFKLSKSSDVAANFYDIVNSTEATPVSGGLLGSLFYTYRPQPRFVVQAELGLSHGVGFAASASYDDPQEHADASILDKPQTFASLAAGAQQGSFATANFNRTFGEALSVNASVQKSDYVLPAFREDSLSAQGNANYRLTKTISLTGGALYSNFVSFAPTSFDVRTLGLPLGIQFTAGHFSAGANVQPTTDFAGTLATGYGANASANFGAFQAGGYFHHDVDIPTVLSVFSQVPGLQAALERAGIDVNDPAQLAAVLNNAALLASLGFTGLRVNVAPARNDIGFNAGWTGPHRTQQLALNYLSSNAQLSQGAFAFRLATLDYTRRLSTGDEVEASVSMLKTVETNNASTTRASQPSYGLTFRHRFHAAPELLFPTRRGSIDGYVYRDDDSAGHYAHGDPGLGGVDVVLDGDHVTRTDASGHYAFSGVAFGPHEVAARIQSAKPFYFTTASPASAEIGSKVNFGVNYVRGKVFGYVTNDAGEGIGGVVVQIAGINKTATSEADGRFVVDGVPPGRYVVTAAPDSFPSGYDLSNFTPATVNVNDNAPWPVAIQARALRSVSGTVTLFDPKKQALRPAAGMEVSIPHLGLTVKTDANGAYAIRDLPAGTFSIQVDGGSAEERRNVTLPADPTTLAGIDFRVTVQQVNDQRRRDRRQGGTKRARRV